MLFKLLAMAMSLFVSTPADNTPPTLPATVDISAIRYIYCTSPEGNYSGSGFLIKDGVVATARHVAHGGQCVDVKTKTKLKSYYEDPVHDFALMSDNGIPKGIPPIKYRCDGIHPGKPYMSYGITDYMQDYPITRENTIIATKDILESDDEVMDFPHSKGMRVFQGYIAPGMSGGPVVDLWGYAVAVNNAGSESHTLLYDLKDTVLCK